MKGTAHSEPMNDDVSKCFKGGPLILKRMMLWSHCLDTKGNGSGDELIKAPHKHVQHQLDVPVLVARE
jgi:hypothetical protein